MLKFLFWSMVGIKSLLGQLYLDLFWSMVGIKSLLGQLYLDLASPPILLQIPTWDHGPHLGIFRLTPKIREFWR
ncbi:MAG: hypothetical protein FD143_3762 [Ignavibacteria bacterium]|nr:MAG: hypothetical protein FD143_3762 [Ignavibacteria bacterium]